MPEKKKNILITGGAGLVGQNLVARIKHFNYSITVIDKHTTNLEILTNLHPEITTINADLSEDWDWESALKSTHTLILLHAQIGGIKQSDFENNNIKATENILSIAKIIDVKHIIHISSSVVNSEASDSYSITKKQQEHLVCASGIPFIVLRPTLMFGWFDRKHLGWLHRFMKRMPVFPIPGSGEFIRQPLYVGDFCAIIESAIKFEYTDIYNISGLEKISYIDIIRAIKLSTSLKTTIVRIPLGVFRALLNLYALFDRNPPFTSTQLDALVIPEVFETVDWPTIFNIPPTPFDRAIENTFSHSRYSNIVLDF